MTLAHPLHLLSRDRMLALAVESIQEYSIFALDPGGCILTWNVGEMTSIQDGTVPTKADSDLTAEALRHLHIAGVRSSTQSMTASTASILTVARFS